MVEEFFFLPFQQYFFLRKALIGCVTLALSCGPLGVFLVLRRMSLMGDALSHALLPGIALGFLLFGFSLPAMTMGGFLAGLVVALLAGTATRFTILHEDANFAGFYLISMAMGVLILSLGKSQVDLMHVLFGSVLSISQESLILLALISSFTLMVLALIYRPLLIECFDPQFFRSVGGQGHRIYMVFLILVTLNLVSAFQALGTLMALGLFLLPAITARLWAKQVWTLCLLATFIGILASYFGLLLSFHFSWPSGPAIVLIAGFFYLLSLLWTGYKMLGKSLGIFLILVPFASSPSFAEEARLKIVVSFSILKDWTQEIAGDYTEIHALVGPNADAHIYEPKPQDLKLLANADLVIINGLGFERWMPRLLEAAGYQGPIIIASEGIVPRQIMMGRQPILDPHAWHDPRNAVLYLNNITSALSKKIPQKAELFQEKARVYQKKLTHLDLWIRQQFAHLPYQERRVITNHDGFGYLGQAYHITFFSPFGLSTEGEPSAFEIAEIIQDSASKGMRCVFLENISNSTLIHQIAQEAHLKVGGVLYSDALSEETGPASTYLQMMEHNILTLIKGIM